MGRTLASGATLLIGWQALLNMAVVSHVVPNTGVPLPLLSYRGSAMITTLAAIGIILSVSRSVDPELRSWRALFAVSDGPWRPARPQPRALVAGTGDVRAARRVARRAVTRRAVRKGVLAEGAQ